MDEGGEEGILCSLQVQLFHLWLPIFIFIFMLIIKVIMVIRVIIVIRLTMVIRVIVVIKIIRVIMVILVIRVKDPKGTQIHRKVLKGTQVP